MRTGSTPQPLDLGAQRGRDVGTIQRIGEIGGEESDLRSAIETLAREFQSVERLRLRERDHGVGELDLAAAEDLGRHNALVKVIGRCLLDGVDTASCGVLLSSRLSLEMVTKAARARFQLVAAVSAPTSLAVEVAERCGITLCGFLRGERCTVYAHRRRIGELGAWLN